VKPIASIKVGDRVRLIGIPKDLDDASTRSTFEECLGKEFAVAAFNEIGYAELQIESITGTSGDKIYVPPRFLKIASKRAASLGSRS
jgi:hypothetical protein